MTYLTVIEDEKHDVNVQKIYPLVHNYRNVYVMRINDYCAELIRTMWFHLLLRKQQDNKSYTYIFAWKRRNGILIIIFSNLKSFEIAPKNKKRSRYLILGAVVLLHYPFKFEKEIWQKFEGIKKNTKCKRHVREIWEKKWEEIQGNLNKIWRRLKIISNNLNN